MQIKKVLDDFRIKGVHLYLKDGELGYSAKKGVITREILESIKEKKTDIINHLKLSDPSCIKFKMSSTSKVRAKLSNRFLWKDYSNGKMIVTTANATHLVFRKQGEFYTNTYNKAIIALFRRHEIFNCAIEKSEGDLWLTHRSNQNAKIDEIVVKGQTLEQREKEAMTIANDLIWKEYNLEEGQLYRISLIRITPSDYILGVGLHHAIGDMVSINMFFHEIMVLYYAILTSTPPRLHPIKYRYIDYLASLETWSTTPGGIEYLNYWKDQLRSTPVTCLKPLEHLSINKLSREEIFEERIEIDSYVNENIKKMAKGLKKTLFCVMLSMYKIAIWRMTGQENLVVVSLQTGRPNNDLMNVIGDFAMEIAYKTDLSGNPDFKEITERVAHKMSEAQSHQPIPLDWVRKALHEEGISFIAPGMSALPENDIETAKKTNIKPLRFPPPGVRHGCHGFPVSCAIEFRESPDSIVGSMIYRTDVYDKSTIKKFLGVFKETIYDAIKNPRKKLYEFVKCNQEDSII